MKHIDKNSLKHFGVCFVISLLGLYGVAFASGASICKEWRDKASYGHWCWWDLLFDALGCGIGFGVHWLIFKSVNF